MTCTIYILAPQDLLLNTKNEMVLPSMCTRENVTVDFPEEIQGSKLVLQTERGIVIMKTRM